MKKDELYEQIEAYLNHTLPPESMRDWEKRLAEDPDLRHSVELHRHLQTDFNAGRLQLRANLRDLLNEPLPPDSPSASGGKRRWGIWLSILGLTLIALWIVWNLKKPAPVAPAPAPIQAPLVIPDSTPAPPKETRPIAVADPARFKPNPGMEAFIKSNVRSESLQINMSRPALGIRLIPNEKGAVSLSFTGTAEWRDDSSPTELVLSFFDNRNTNQPLMAVPIRLQKDALNSLKFDLQQSLKFPPGLYYFTLEEVDKGEVLYAGKFLIEAN